MKKLTVASKYYAIPDGFEDEHDIKITESGDSYKMELDGKEIIADFVKTGENLYSLIIDNKSYEIDIHYDGEKYEILVDGDYYKVEVLDELKKMLRDRTSQALQGRQVISTSMPGLVTKVMVSQGQEVKEGDPLLILVAMKMENQIKSPKDGVVQELFVSENQTVSVGDKLAVID